MTDKTPDPAAFPKIEFPGVYLVEIEVTGLIRLEVKADGHEGAKLLAREAADKIVDDGYSDELDEIMDARVYTTAKKGSLYRVLRGGQKYQTTHLRPGDMPREPDERGF